MELPAPLEGVDVDRGWVRGRRRRPVLDDHGEREEAEDDEDRDDRVDDLEQRVVLGLAGILVVLRR